MTNEYLLDVIGEIDERFILCKAPARSRAGIRRVLALAALLALLAALWTSACALNWFGLRDFIVNGRSASKTGAPSAAQGGNMLSLQGFADAPESKALLEWRQFLESYDTDKAILNSIGDNATGLELAYGCYTVYTQEMADSLNKILEKYGLQKHTRAYPASYDEIAAAVGGRFLPSDVLSGAGYIYEDGAFLLEANWQSISLSLFRSVSGKLTDIFVCLADLREYTEHMYESNGRPMLIAEGTDNALLLADLGECFIALSCRSCEEAPYVSLLKCLADAVNWDLLAKAAAPDFEEIFGRPDIDALWNIRTLPADPATYQYCLTLRSNYDNCRAGNLRYALWDVDGCGERELLMETAGSGFRRWEIVGMPEARAYDYGPLTQSCAEGAVVRFFARESGGIYIMIDDMLYAIALDGGHARCEGAYRAEIGFMPSNTEIEVSPLYDLSPLLCSSTPDQPVRDNALPPLLPPAYNEAQEAAAGAGFRDILAQAALEDENACFALCDLDGDRIDELLLPGRTCLVYREAADGGAVFAGSFSAADTALYLRDEGGLYAVFGRMGTEILYAITMENGEIFQKELASRFVDFSEEGAAYTVPSESPLEILPVSGGARK